MCLTEPQAGSDLAQVRTRAVPEGDHHRISGTKIFITFGEHDMAENIIHLVLARLPDAPEGTKGISLFIVPKFLVNDDGSLGERNDVVCASIEHKLGINGNPTCTLNYGEKGGGAVGYLVGEPNRGLEYMFIMMNAARFSVGVQGIALADRAYQSALEYAKERIQGRDLKPGSRTPGGDHQASRRAAHADAAEGDDRGDARARLRHRGLAGLRAAPPRRRVRKEHKAFVELMIPVVKGWCTENAVDLCSTALQVFGGMGYIEETGIAQQYRDVRIITIYEGTTGIQALDLVGRKLLRDMGATRDARRQEDGGRRPTSAPRTRIPRSSASASAGARPRRARTKRRKSIGMSAMGDLHQAFACSVPYLRLWGTVAGGWQMARAGEDLGRQRSPRATPKSEFYRAKLATAAFYATHVLSQAAVVSGQIVERARPT